VVFAVMKIFKKNIPNIIFSTMKYSFSENKVKIEDLLKDILNGNQSNKIILHKIKML
jgi:hypothetical protein